MTDPISSKKKVLITGANGQLGWELQRTAPVTVELLAYDRQALDICERSSVERIIEEKRSDLIVNCAAYTAVDRAEQDPAAAQDINVVGASNLARAATERVTKLIHISTDFIFDGKQSDPYVPGDAPQSTKYLWSNQAGW